MKRRSVLGKGLNSLLPDGGDPEGGHDNRPYFLTALDSIQPNEYQPRQVMADGPLRQLADSIKANGVLQPLVVRRRDDGPGYELIAGERRWRAARLAGLTDVPVLVREATEGDRLELALIENLQRQDLNPLEEGEAYHRLVREFGLSQEEVAGRVGKDRSTVANAIRLLQLPRFAKQDVVEGLLSMGHARLLLGLADEDVMREVRDEIVKKGLSVRQAEALVKARKTVNGPKLKKNIAALPESYCRALTTDLLRFLGAKTRIVQNGSRGKLEIEYYSADDLERLLGLIKGRDEQAKP